MQNNDFTSPIEYSLSLIGGKWKLMIIFNLATNKVMRYGELKKALKSVTHKMLSQQLKELEADNLIIRKQYDQIPLKVEYSLSKKGESLNPILSSLVNWGTENMKK